MLIFTLLFCSGVSTILSRDSLALWKSFLYNVFLERGVRAFLPSRSFGGPLVLEFSLSFCATKQVRDQSCVLTIQNQYSTLIFKMKKACFFRKTVNNIKGAMSSFVYFEKIGYFFFHNCHCQFISIFSILCYPCSFMFKNHPFGVFLP